MTSLIMPSLVNPPHLAVFTCKRVAAVALIDIGRSTSSDKRLFGSTLRNYLGFLVSHFWLLSESVDSLCFLNSSVSSTRRADEIKSSQEQCHNGWVKVHK